MIECGSWIYNYRCFQEKGGGFDKLMPVNLIIGRNNSGKSCLLNLVQYLANRDASIFDKDAIVEFKWCLFENELKRVFSVSTPYGALEGNHWDDHGRLFVNSNVKWKINPANSTVKDFNLLDVEIASRYGEESTRERKSLLKNVLQDKSHPLNGKHFRRLYADRDIVPEKAENNLKLGSNGAGCTNIIRRFLTSSNERYTRRIIQEDLLSAMNEIFVPDSTFTEINIQSHDDPTNKQLEGKWEVYLVESRKELIPLSQSGSGLRTIILVLLNMIVMPHTINPKPSDSIFVFEELENNLHPSLQRRLFRYLEKFAVDNNYFIFLSSHSNVAVDIFGSSLNAQIIHMLHDGNEATTKPVETHFEKLDILTDIGARASDLLQANGLVWLEGPSDRIYFNKWVEIFSEDEIREGREYECVYFGGSIIENFQIIDPDERDKEKINIIHINPNAVMIVDGDRTSPTGKGSRLKSKVVRLRKEFQSRKENFIWITKAKEVENYLPADAIRQIWKNPKLKEIRQYDWFYHEPSKKNKLKGYFQKFAPVKSFNKVEFAKRIVPHLTRDNLVDKFELADQMKKICDIIKKWNQ